MSATTNAAAINGTNTPSSQASNSSGSRAQLKMSTSGKAIDGSRKQAGSPVDNPQRKPQKAWTGTNNPITQRPSNMSNSNGVASNAKATTSPKPVAPQTSDASVVAEKHTNDRMIFLLANLIGLPATFTLKNGDRYSGIVSGASIEELKYVFKMVKRIQLANGSEVTDEYSGVGEDHLLSVDMVDVSDLAVNDVKLDKVQSRTQNGASTSFRTDADIAGNLAIRERELVPWQPSEDADPGYTLEDSGKPWDQFEANDRLYGVKSSYDENLYTTTIDRNQASYSENYAKADKVAREIEKSSATSRHIAEERGLNVPDDSGLDEEEKYSGVRRDFPPLSSGQPNKYTPPARRAPTGQATVPGAPVDPAIISSSIARPSQSGKTPPPVRQEKPADKAAPPSAPAAAEAVQPEKPYAPATSTAASQPSASKAAPNANENAEATNSHESNAPPPLAATPASGNGQRVPPRPENATANVEQNLLESFKKFSSQEKQRVQNQHREMIKKDKAVKLNDLKKFSEMFKLNTPVPSDLVPILAKDETKQQEIVEKALRNVHEAKTTPTKPAASIADPKPTRAAQPVTSPSPQVDKPSVGRQQRQPNYPSASMRGHHAQNVNTRSGNLSQRLNITSQQHKSGNTHVPVPHPQPIHDIRIPSGPSASTSGAQTPLSSASLRFNVRAMEFKPNPAANTFTPGGATSNASSPRIQTPARVEPRKIVITSFFGNQKPPIHVDISILEEGFNPIKRMEKEVQGDEKKQKDYAPNGGIPNAFRTPPVWEVKEENGNKKYIDCFQTQPTAQPISAPHTQLGGPPMPHQHQLPPHLQQQVPPNMHQNHTPQHTPRHPHVQPHQGQGVPHFEGGHAMQFSTSQPPVHPSRPMHHYSYGPQMPQAMPPGAVFQQPMPGYGMTPTMHHTNLRQPSGGPQFVNTMPVAAGGHMMMQTPSNGPFMVPGNPQMPMYSPAPNQVYPHHGAPMPVPPGSNGFPSPRSHGAQMMSHQGSQQGHPQQAPIMYMQHGAHPQMMAMPQGPMNTPARHFPQHQQMHFGSPHQAHPYPQQSHRGTPNTTYSTPMMPTQSMPPHPQSGPHVPNGDDAK